MSIGWFVFCWVYVWGKGWLVWKCVYVWDGVLGLGGVFWDGSYGGMLCFVDCMVLGKEGGGDLVFFGGFWGLE